uniref:Uncharacterized protein n=1 Tax=Melopsittacus undulatus TaxID=13146 RepID=A0A8C6J857_MELUD
MVAISGEVPRCPRCRDPPAGTARPGTAPSWRQMERGRRPPHPRAPPAAAAARLRHPPGPPAAPLGYRGATTGHCSITIPVRQWGLAPAQPRQTLIPCLSPPRCHSTSGWGQAVGLRAW